MKSIVVLLTLFGLCQGQANHGCPKGFIRFRVTERCFYISDEIATFDSAKENCESRNSQLAPVLTYDEQVDLSAVMATQIGKCRGKSNCMKFWIGIRSVQDVLGNKDWGIRPFLTVDKNFGLWAEGYPKNREGCVFMSFEDSIKRGNWKNDDCNRQLKYVCITCPDNFTYVPEVNECLYVNTQKMKWKDAQLACTKFKKGAQLVAIKNRKKADAVTLFVFHNGKDGRQLMCTFQGNKDIHDITWIGAQTQDPKECSSPFVWKPLGAEEKPLTFTHWLPGQPDCKENNENCAYIYRENYKNDDYKWKSVSCDSVFCSVCAFE